MHPGGSVRYLLPRLPSTATATCNAFLLFIVAVSCHKSAPPQPPDNVPDTTSHNFVWSVDIIGNGGGGLKDIALIDDTLAFAAGGVYMQDSTGYVDPNPYNFFRWNGHAWTMIRLQFYTLCGQMDRYPYPTGAVLCFGPTDIWIATEGNEVTHWNGSAQDTTYCLGSQSPTIRKLWGQSRQSIYAVCDLGTFLHFNGSTWQTIPTGTNIDLIDLYGTADNNLWIAGLDLTTGKKSGLFHWNGATFREVYEYVASAPQYRSDTISGTLSSVWTSDPNHVWVLANGIYLASYSTLGEARLLWAPPSFIGYPWRIRGSEPNNVFVVGDFETIVHYNGSTWHQSSNFTSTTAFRSVATNGQSVFIVGFTASGGIVYRGRRM
jgi:hypothetical protein